MSASLCQLWDLNNNNTVWHSNTNSFSLVVFLHQMNNLCINTYLENEDVHFGEVPSRLQYRNKCKQYVLFKISRYFQYTEYSIYTFNIYNSTYDSIYTLCLMSSCMWSLEQLFHTGLEKNTLEWRGHKNLSMFDKRPLHINQTAARIENKIRGGKKEQNDSKVEEMNIRKQNQHYLISTHASCKLSI